MSTEVHRVLLYMVGGVAIVATVFAPRLAAIGTRQPVRRAAGTIRPADRYSAPAPSPVTAGRASPVFAAGVSEVSSLSRWR
jgi:hypothetical protein